ncbi:hypothetical protein [Frederiksenia canicola]|uniref:Uncharacterized protein n=1 Tax=Frederiksenia canicola TaxID=123824 RepID=A0ABX9XSY3_9PAST|nr:hypothetical protein [Frederiksenia canicola]RPE96302.1 hypothetical protein EDC49_0691 [Frederiksenia canicola]
MMKKLLLSLLLLPLSVGALETGQSCAKIDADIKRLACYDSIFRTGNNSQNVQDYTGSIKPFKSQSNLTAKSSPLPKSKSSKSTKSVSKPKKSSSRSSYGGSCPCSGSIDCVGPRGGTYCYTSGGNKRYR